MFFIEDTKGFVSPEKIGDVPERGPGARFSKDPKTSRARKAIRKTPIRLFYKAGLFTCCKGNKN